MCTSPDSSCGSSDRTIQLASSSQSAFYESTHIPEHVSACGAPPMHRSRVIHRPTRPRTNHKRCSQLIMVNRRWLIGIGRNQRLLWAAIVLAACQTGDSGQFRNTSDQQRITAIDYTSAACPQRMLQTNSMLKCKRSLWDGREWSSKGISRHCSANWSFHSFVILHFYNFRG